MEIARLRRHFDGALTLLGSRDEARLPLGPRKRRERLIRELVAYRARGRFPKNDRFARRTPFFIDVVGTRCAMAHLIERSGDAAFVERVASSQNNAWMRELAGEELDEWLRAHGLTLAEAARIQPTYGPDWGKRPACYYRADGLLRATIVSDRQARVTSLLDSKTTLKIGQVVELDAGGVRIDGKSDPLRGYKVGDAILIAPAVDKTDDGKNESIWVVDMGPLMSSVSVAEYVQTPACARRVAGSAQPTAPPDATIPAPDATPSASQASATAPSASPAASASSTQRDPSADAEGGCAGCATSSGAPAAPSDIAYVAGALVVAWTRRRRRD